MMPCYTRGKHTIKFICLLLLAGFTTLSAGAGTPPAVGLTSFDGATFGLSYFNGQPSGTRQANLLASGFDFIPVALLGTDPVTLQLTSGAGYGVATAANNRFVRAIRGALGASQLQSLQVYSDDASAFDLQSVAVQSSVIPQTDIATITLTAYRSGVPVGSPVTLTGQTNGGWILVATPTFIGIDEFVVSATDASGGQIGAIGVDAISVDQTPSVTTLAATGVSSNAATLNGTLNDNSSSTTASFLYSTDPGLAGATTVAAAPTIVAAGTGNTAISYHLTGLLPLTTYYYKASGTNGAGTAAGAILSFTTAPLILVTPAALAPATVGVPYGPIAFTATGGTAPYTYAVSGGILPPGLSLDANTGALSGTPTASGAYGFVVTATDAQSFSSTADYLTLTINAPSAFTFSPGTIGTGQYETTYPPVTFTVSGGTAPYSNFSLASGTLPPGISLSTAGVLSGTPTATGTYTFSLQATDASGGSGPYTEASPAYTLIIGQATLTITADNQTTTYGTGIPSLTLTYSGFVNGDNTASLTTLPTITTTASMGSPVGNYPISVSGAVDPNYAITYVSGTLTIGMTPLTITADNQNMTYGSALPPFTVTYSGFVNGDNTSSLTTPPAITTSATSASPAGTYSILPSGALDPNYSITYVNGVLTIGQAPLLVTADDQSRYFGQDNPTFTFTYTGFVNSDGPSVFTVLPVGTTPATVASAPGTYPITGSGGVATNYILTYQDGTLTVLNTLPNTLTFGPLIVKTYGDPDFVVSATASSGLPVSFVSADNTIATVSQDASGNWVVHIVSAGEVTISATQAGNSEYATAAQVDQLLLVNKANQTISFPPPLGTTPGVPVSLGAMATSGLPITYSVSNPSLATLSGNQVTGTGTGTLIVTAAQNGNVDYNPAIPVSDTLQIFGGGSFKSGIGIFPNPAHGTLFIHFTQDFVVTKVMIFDILGRKVLSSDQYELFPRTLSVNVGTLMPGIYIVRVVSLLNGSEVDPVFKVEIQ